MINRPHLPRVLEEHISKAHVNSEVLWEYNANSIIRLLCSILWLCVILKHDCMPPVTPLRYV